jgi:hypothetical protein
MGRQINFFLHPDDQEEFDKILKSVAECALLPFQQYSNNPTVVQDTVIRNLDNEGTRIYMVKPEHFPDLELEYNERHNYWFINDKEAPVIHFDRSIYKDGKIKRGRLYFQTQYLKNSEWVSKPENFVKWGDKLLRTARRKLKKYNWGEGRYQYTEYLGENALQWLRDTNALISRSGLEIISNS